jgi:hypothetical protein
MENQDKFEQWAIVELMGHVKIAGRVTEEERFGAKLGRVDIPNGDTFVTQYFNGSSLYRLTPTTEEIARSVAKSNQPSPVYRWELPESKQIGAGEPIVEVEYPNDDDEDEDSDDEERPF